jgi:hypothetical protein
MKRIPEINLWLHDVINGHELLTSVLASQVISNVPAAILLSGFTDNISTLIVGTNIGGLGTIIASMASLILLNIMVPQQVREIQLILECLPC